MRTRLAAGMAVLGSVLLAAQEPAAPRFRVAVDAVRIDAVVTDKDGHVVRDLKAEDFEVLQDGRAQPVTFIQFVPIVMAPVSAAPSAARPNKDSPGDAAPPRPVSGTVRREHIQRTIALVVDDLGMSLESLYYVKRGLHAFIDRTMQDGDLVALVRTGGSMDGLQPFTTDRRVLHAAVDNLKWNAFSRSGVEAFAPVNQSMELDVHASFSPDDFKALDAFRNSAMAAGTLGALNLVIQGARDLPGRKAIMFVSEGFAVLERDTRSPDARVRGPLDRAIDQATRAGVVIYSIDARGLQSGALLASDNLKVNLPGQAADNLSSLDAAARQNQQERSDARRDTQEGMAYLAEQTGGFAVLNNNDLGAGLARAAQDIRDYYIIGYTPDTGTFAAKGKTPEYHKIAVRVKRAGLKVRTRREFFGVSDVDETTEALSPAQQLVNAAISPFTGTEIALRATSLPGYSPSRGLFVRALLHIDASALTFTKGSDGKSAAAADVLGMVFDRDGTEVAHLSTAFSATLADGETGDLGEGLAYTLRVPIPNPGPYQLRFAVRDRQSGHVGTAGEFVELPDVGHGAFALSGIVLRSDADARGPSAGDDRVTISPSQAVRVYKPGSQLTYAYEVYNAGAEPVRVAISVWRGNERIMGAAPNTLAPPAGQGAWFAAGGAFKLGEALAPGHYVLQVAATTEPGKIGKSRRALQVMDFEVK